MSISVPDVLALAMAAGGKQPPMQTFADLLTLYTVYEQVQGKTFDPAAMQKAGTLEPLAAALARTTAIVDALLKDPAQAPRVIVLYQSMKG